MKGVDFLYVLEIAKNKVILIQIAFGGGIIDIDVDGEL